MRATTAESSAGTSARSPCNAGPDQWSTGLPAYFIAEAGGNSDPCADNDTSALPGALTYTTPPFRTASTLAGPMDATLYLTSTTPESEVVATVDVRPYAESSRHTYLTGLSCADRCDCMD